MKNGLSVFSSELAEIQGAIRQHNPEKYRWTFEDVVMWCYLKVGEEKGVTE